MNNRWKSTIAEALIIGLMLSLTLLALVRFWDVGVGTLRAAQTPTDLITAQDAEQLREALAEIRGRASFDPNGGFYYDVSNRALLGLGERAQEELHDPPGGEE